MIEMEISFDFGSVDRYLTDMERSQIPFATSRAMNRTMNMAQRAVRNEAYNKAFTQRNKTLAKALTTIPGKYRATKKNLRVSMMAVKDKRTGRIAGEGFVKRQIANRSKTPQGSAIAIPQLGRGLRRNKGGSLPKGKKPRTNKKLFKVGRRLVERQRGDKLVTRFVLAKKARPSRRGPFRYYETAIQTTNRTLQRNWNREMMLAVASTARRYAAKGPGVTQPMKQ